MKEPIVPFQVGVKHSGYGRRVQGGQTVEDSIQVNAHRRPTSYAYASNLPMVPSSLGHVEKYPAVLQYTLLDNVRALQILKYLKGSVLKARLA